MLHKRSKIYLSILLSLLCFIDIHAQKLNVESFAAKTIDMAARTQPRKDINGNDCALIEVRLAARNASFKGNVVGNVAYDKSEYSVYMPHGSKRLTIKLEGYLPLDVNFEEFGINTLEGKTVYVMTIAGVTGTQQLEAPKTKTGWIILDSEPSGASVYINDEFVGNTPLNNYKQAYGTYQYRLEHPNYHSSGGTINLNAGRYEDKIVMKPAFGSVDVKSSVVGAEVLLDGKTTGKRTPCTLSEVASGRHTITLRLNKYAPQQQEVTVEDGQTAQVSVSMDARFASVTINSLQGAQIYCNGKVIGTGRCTEDMMEGYYDLEARLAHHKPVTKQIQVVAGQSQEISMNPTPIYGSLDIISTPRDATITIDGKEVGKSPLSVEEILEGEHQIVISIDGYEKETKYIVIKEGEMVNIEVALKEDQLNNKSWPEISKLLFEYQMSKKDVSDIFNKYITSANHGDVLSQTIVGYIYENGIGMDRNTEEAVKWYRKAADQGYAAAQMELATCYSLGLGLPKNNTESIRLTRLAADQNYAPAQNQLGYNYSYGHGVKMDKNEGAKWYRKAAEQGDVGAQSALGDMYRNGEGVPQDYAEAVKWLRKAAEQGDCMAQNNLGECFLNGKGVPQNYTEAMKWFRKAAENGNAIAYVNLGFMYEKGQGVPQDYKEAIKWYRKAAGYGFEYARKALERLEK